jgi:hypothetical protein
LINSKGLPKSISLKTKYPFVEIKFYMNKEVGDKLGGFSGWENAGFVWGGGYFICRWALGDSTVIYPGTSVELPEMELTGGIVYKGMQLDIAIVADMMKKVSYLVPVKFLN